MKRTDAALPILEALDSPLLDAVKSFPHDLNTWCNVPYVAMSSGEQVIIGWLTARVWPGRPGLRSEWTIDDVLGLDPLGDRIAWCRMVSDADRALSAMTLLEVAA